MKPYMSKAFAAEVTRGAVPPAQRIKVGQVTVRPPVASCLRISVAEPARPVVGALAKTSDVTFAKDDLEHAGGVEIERENPRAITGVALVSA